MASAYGDNLAFDGELSPMVILFLLLAVSDLAAGLWGMRGWIAAADAWICRKLICYSPAIRVLSRTHCKDKRLRGPTNTCVPLTGFRQRWSLVGFER